MFRTKVSLKTSLMAVKVTQMGTFSLKIHIISHKISLKRLPNYKLIKISTYKKIKT